MKKHTLVALALCVSGLLGCSSSDDEDELVLPEIVNQFDTKVHWDTSIGDGVENFFSRLSPALHNQTIYAADRNGIVKAFDLESGDEKWRTDVRDNPAFWPWEDDDGAKLSGGILHAFGKLFIGSEHGEVIALDRDNGEVIWRVSVPGEALSKPAAGDGLVFVNLGSGKLIALHPDNGEQRWSYEQEVPALTLRGLSSPQVANGGVIVGEESGKLSVLISENGFQAWQAEIASPKGASEFERLVDVDTQPVVRGGMVYSLAYNGNLAAVDIRSGRVVWKREYSGFRDIKLSGNSLYLVDSKDVIYSLELDSGIERWSQPALSGWKVTGPEVLGDYLAVGDVEGHLHWLEKESGNLVSRSEFDSSGFFISPLAADDKLIIYTRDGEMSVVSPKQSN